MNTGSFDPNLLNQSVVAVPPLARDADFQIDADQNDAIVRHIESGGVRSLLYGGNAVLYHTSLDDLNTLCGVISDAAGPETTVVPSIGPSLGAALDQAEVINHFDFGTVMLLPSRDIVDSVGIASGVRILSEQLQRPIVLYLKYDRWMDPRDIAVLERDGLISWIKYAVVRQDPSQDEYLREVTDVFPKSRIVSGIGEQPAIVHLRDFGLTGFTSGCVCVTPQQSMDMLGSIQAGDFEHAETIRQFFQPLENLRDTIHPIRVLHHAVAAAGIADTGPIQPMLSGVDDETKQKIDAALHQMGILA